MGTNTRNWGLIEITSEAALYADRLRTRDREHNEENHIKGKSQEVIELFKTIDKFCRELDPTVQRKYRSMYISYSHRDNIFCCVNLRKSGLRVWLKLNYSELENPPSYIRDVSNIGHWGVGNTELIIDSIQRFQDVKGLIQKSFAQGSIK